MRLLRLLGMTVALFLLVGVAVPALASAAPAPDRDKMGAVRELEALWEARGRPEEARWLLEELRVSHFAQALGVRGQVSAKKVRRLLQG